jgi:hypothetical protein
MAWVSGFEPLIPVLETGVLPLHYTQPMVPMEGFEPSYVPLRRRVPIQLDYMGIEMDPTTGLEPAYFSGRSRMFIQLNYVGVKTLLVPSFGIEPKPADSKSAILPLDEEGMVG